MSQEIKFLSLQKPELTYEVAIRGDTPANNVTELRKQISKLGPSFPSEDVLASCFDPSDDIKGVSESIGRLDSAVDQLLVTPTDKGLIGRSMNLSKHISFRLCRIDCSSSLELQSTLRKVIDCYDKIKTVLDSPNFFQKSSAVSSLTEDGNINSSPQQILVSCNHGSNDFSSIKFNGKTCVRQFITLVKDFIQCRKISFDKLIAHGTEVFTDDALHWFRHIKTQIGTWDELCARLIADFGPPDFDYRFLDEIKARTQGERENITIYLAIMNAMFSQLNYEMSDEQKLEILLHNIRPCYADVLASAGSISSIDQLQSLCRNYESIQCRISQFREPPKVTSYTLAPTFAYTSPSTSFTTNKYNSYNNNKQFNNQNNFNKKFTTNYNPNKSESPNNNLEQNVRPVYAVDKVRKFCPRCRVDSHNLRNCTAERKIVCFRCGKPEVRFHECPDCQGFDNSQTKN